MESNYIQSYTIFFYTILHFHHLKHLLHFYVRHLPNRFFDNYMPIQTNLCWHYVHFWYITGRWYRLWHILIYFFIMLLLLPLCVALRSPDCSCWPCLIADYIQTPWSRPWMQLYYHFGIAGFLDNQLMVDNTGLYNWNFLLDKFQVVCIFSKWNGFVKD